MASTSSQPSCDNRPAASFCVIEAGKRRDIISMGPSVFDEGPGQGAANCFVGGVEG